jgi:hypothetical protein
MTWIMPQGFICLTVSRLCFVNEGPSELTRAHFASRE